LSVSEWLWLWFSFSFSWYRYVSVYVYVYHRSERYTTVPTVYRGTPIAWMQSSSTSRLLVTDSKRECGCTGCAASVDMDVNHTDVVNVDVDVDPRMYPIQTAAARRRTDEIPAVVLL